MKDKSSVKLVVIFFINMFFFTIFTNVSIGKVISFELDISPIIVNKCINCHMPGRNHLSFSYNSSENYNTLIDKAFVIPGEVNKSKLYKMIKSKHSLVNLPSKTEEQLIMQWIRDGAAE